MPLCKLSQKDEAEIYYLYHYGSRIRTQEEIANFYKVSQQTVCNALQRFELLLERLKNAEYKSRLVELGEEVSEARLRLICQGAIPSDSPVPLLTYEG